jgi:hypothetical protein
MRLHGWRLLLGAGMIAAAFSGCTKKEETAQPPAATGSMKPAAAHGLSSEAAPADSAGLRFTAPPDWISEAPGSPMRRAQYRLPRAEGDSEDAEVVVFYFQGGGGGVQANIDRWIDQFSKPDGSPAGDSAKISKRVVGGIPVSIVDVSGSYSGAMGPMGGSSRPKTGYRMLAAVAEADNGPWFLKLTGPARTVARWQASFESFVDTIRR